MTEITELRSLVVDHIDSLASELVQVSHEIHAHPELNFEEHFASDLLCATASRHGMERRVDEPRVRLQMHACLD